MNILLHYLLIFVNFINVIFKSLFVAIRLFQAYWIME